MGYDLKLINEVVSSLQSKKRYDHTVGVQNEAYFLGQIYLPEKADKLSLAGLLHDITKDFKLEEQLALCDEYGIFVDKDNIIPKLLHSKTGCEYSRRRFGADIIDDEIYNGILYHTTGRANMSLFESIIYLADYIEKGRTFIDCVILRSYFYDSLKNASSYDEKLDVLRKTMLMSFDLTIKNLLDEGKEIDYDTLSARNYFIKNKNAFDFAEE